MYLIFGHKVNQSCGGALDLLEVITPKDLPYVPSDATKTVLIQFTEYKIKEWINKFFGESDAESEKEALEWIEIYAFDPESNHYFEAYWDNGTKFRTVENPMGLTFNW